MSGTVAVEEGKEVNAKVTAFSIGLVIGALAHIIVFSFFGGPFLFLLFAGQSLGSGLLTIIIASALRRRALKTEESRWLDYKWSPPYFGPQIEHRERLEGIWALDRIVVAGNVFVNASPSASIAPKRISLYGGERPCRQHGIKNCCPPE